MLFREVIGQQETKSLLVQSVKQGFIPHARLFAGQEGVGKLALALAYARYVLCTDRQESDACGVCPSCQKLNKLSHPDLHFVFPVFNKTSGKKTLTDDFLPQWRDYVLQSPYFRLSSWLDYVGAGNAQGMIYAHEADNIIKKLNLRAYESDYKIMIIWLPEKMNEAASNTLLKLLEEPPEKTIFLLVSEESDKVLTTILSRTQILTIPPIADDDLAAAINKQYNLPADELTLTLRLAHGSYLKALDIIESSEDNELFLDLFVTIMRNSWKRDVKNMKAKADFFASLGRDKQKNFLSYAQRYIRENFFYRLHIPELNYLNAKETAFSQNFAPYVKETNVIEFMEELSLAEQHIERNVNPRMVFFDLSMKIAVLLKK